jgi:glutamate-ammonia-ligase adenylyltransferase
MVRDNPAAAELLCTVLGTSRLLGDLLARHPELLTAMADQHRLAAASRGPAELVASATAIVARHADPAAAWDGLRRFKRRELVRVAVRDLTGDLPVEQVGAELSALAQACLGAGLLIAMREAGEGRDPRVAVLAMGKLGGNELSYTSDLDVLFCHEPVPGADPEVAAKAADRVVRELLRGLSAVTPEGTCFQVDPNLRPEGRNGPLSRTLGSFLAYWDRWAQPWELQALIKVRPVAGDMELAARFCAEAEARVYRELDAATVAEVRRMKARVESERLPAGADPKLHLKLGPGGLADVEWTAQLLQLRTGGSEPSVRVQGTLPALEALAAIGALEAGEADWLADAYRLCQRIRNVAYLAAGRPVDILPTDPVALERLARAMGGPGRQRLLEDYRRATRRARRVVDTRFWDDPR